MTVTLFSNRDVERDSEDAMRAAEKGPVLIADATDPAYVLITYDEYVRRGGKPISPSHVSGGATAK